LIKNLLAKNIGGAILPAAHYFDLAPLPSFAKLLKLSFEETFHEKIVGILTFALERLTDTEPNLENKK
jgi:hypothetical protein